MNNRFLRTVCLPSFLYLLSLLCLFVSSGCGGGGGGGGSSNQVGSANLTIVWPVRRLIPVASDSIRVSFKLGTTDVASQVIARPASGNQTTATFSNLKVGNLTLTATAYPNTDATGVAQAQGSTPVTITNGQTTAVTLTMDSTIDHLEVAPTTPSVLVGQTAGLTVTAKDLAGAVVLILPDTIQWTSGDTALATVTTAGVVKGIAPTGATPGSVQLTVTESESGKSLQVPVAVTSNTTVAVLPGTHTLSVGDPKTFTANVTNAPDTSVSWSIQEGAAGGSITSAGAYTAPPLPGTYHIVATSQYDNSKSTTATVTVQAGNSDVIIK